MFSVLVPRARLKYYRARGAPGALRAACSTLTLDVMALVRVLSPQSESEIAVVTSLLEAHDIPVFIHGRAPRKSVARTADW